MLLIGFTTIMSMLPTQSFSTVTTELETIYRKISQCLELFLAFWGSFANRGTPFLKTVLIVQWQRQLLLATTQLENKSYIPYCHINRKRGNSINLNDRKTFFHVLRCDKSHIRTVIYMRFAEVTVDGGGQRGDEGNG